MSSTPARTVRDPIQTDGVTSALTRFINSTIMAPGHVVQPDDDLEAAGVDSMGLLKILLFIEARFGFWMPDDDLVEANIRSAWTLASYVCRHHADPRSCS